jgi:hypothetical protein
MCIIREGARFFYQCGEYGWEKYGRYLSRVDILACDKWGNEYIGQRIADEHDRYERECLCWGYIGEALNGLLHGGMTDRLYDMLKGTSKPQKTAEEATEDIMAEFRRLGGEIE